ncbi:MAG: hypothetical protein MJ109_05950 [Kiritimatiellae bacterium]|nr:hypothetical protein [Kiritimatiellia bacterium]
MKKLIAISMISLAAVASAEVMDRPQGIKIGTRMTLRPYVSLSYTYDTNMRSQSEHEIKSGSWTISPNLAISYNHENWGIDGNVFYSYHAYEKSSANNNQNSYGESLSWHWADSSLNEKGWSFMMMENYQQILEDDDMTSSGGHGYGRDRQQFNFAASAERRITDRLHAGLNAGYYWLDYKNDSNKYAPLYGWSRWNVGAEVGYVLSRWTDIIVAGSYQNYDQDNDKNLAGNPGDVYKRNNLSSGSEGYTVQGGFQSRATERISYRLLAGWSRFEYSNAGSDDGFTYTASGNWRHTDTLSSALMASSYYQPSEKDFGSSQRVDQLSWGIQKSLVSSKLNATFDVAYRRTERTYTVYARNTKPIEDIITARFGLNYTLNRFAAIYGNIEYSTYKQSKGYGEDYDRWRGTVGVRLSY